MRISELLTTRLCHELSGPIAAINNGIELLCDEDPDLSALTGANFLNDAVALVSDSARRARNRLQFYRFAYGFSRLSATTGPAPHELATGLFAASRIVCDYAESVRIMSLHWQKLACNLLPLGADALPRGGRLWLTDDPLTVEAVGEAAAFAPEARAALMLTTPINELTARTVQAYFAGLLAKALDCRLIAAAEPGRVRLTAIAEAV
jgi:histidine phosphotransferase ChpT